MLEHGVGDHPVTVTIERSVAPGREHEFERWAHSLTETASRFRGFLGAGLLRPGTEGQPWHVVYRFDSAENLGTWEASHERTRLLDRAGHLMETTAVRKFTGLETWFSLPGLSAAAPPRWKMFLVTVGGIYVLQVILNLVIGDLVRTWTLALRLGVFAASVTALMTWVVMPRLALYLASWLYPEERR